MKKILLLFSLLCCLMAGRAWASGPTAVTAEFLRADGTLNLPAMAGRNLSLDLKGWNVSLDPTLGPVFAPAAAGFNALDQGLSFTVFAIAVSSTGDVYVGGQFEGIAGSTAVAGLNYIAKWNGTAWSALDYGLNDYVNAIAISGSDVYVGGGFSGVDWSATSVEGLNYIAKWNGTAWSALDKGLNVSVQAIAISGSDVYVGGDFTNVGSGGTEVEGLNYIAKWNGTAWSALDKGLNQPVYDIAVSGSTVYAGGNFTDVNWSATSVAGLNYIAKWNGTAWSALDKGLNNPVNNIAISGSTVYVGGYFLGVGSGGTAVAGLNNIAKWNGTAWSALDKGLNQSVVAIAISGSTVYVGGGFTNVGSGGTAVTGLNNIAKWGEVAATPTLTATGTPTAFTACSGTASAEQSFTVSGSDLTGDITVTAPTGFEVSKTSGSGFVGSVTLTPSGGAVATTTIYVRMKNNATGTPSGNVTVASTGATDKTVAVSGTVNALPTITLGTINSVSTSATSFSLPYSNPTGNPNQYSISTGTPTAMPSFTAVSNTTLGTSPISVTIPASAANTYNFNLTVRNSTTGCVSTNVPFTVTVTPPTITVSTSTLTAFTACAGTASAEQSFTVSGSDLTANISVTAPTGFEVSKTSGSDFGTSVTLTQSGGAVATTTIYVRLKNNATGTPSGNVTAASAGATDKTVAVSGTINAPARITRAPLLFHNRCEGGSITLSITATGTSPITYQWEKGATNVGLNLPSLTLNNLTIADAGGYSVTASNTCGSDTYGTINLTVNALPTFTVGTPIKPTTCVATDGSLPLNGLANSTS